MDSFWVYLTVLAAGLWFGLNALIDAGAASVAASIATAAGA